jgi:beta-lactamase class A
VVTLRTRDLSIGCIATAAAVLAVGAVFGGLFGYSLHLHESGDCRQYSLLNPLIRCQRETSGVFMPEYEEFEFELRTWIEHQRRAGLIDQGAVYFRDLVGGPWFGIDEDAQFTPASLFKVPLMIAILRVSEIDPQLLTQEIIMSGSYVGLTNVEHPGETLQPGRPYAVRELLEKMIVYSDNASSDMLKNLLGVLDPSGKALETMYRELGMYVAATEHTLSVKTYSSLFRVLFNGRYLKPETSQFALQLLSRSAYTDAIVAGIPAGIPVAHKFGIRDIPGEERKQFHDCGIVYYPRRPYLLCIMTSSHDVHAGVTFIREVSRRVYTQVDARMHAEVSASE